MIVEHKVCESCGRMFLRETGTPLRYCVNHAHRETVRTINQPATVENKPALTKLSRRQLAWATAFEGRR